MFTGIVREQGRVAAVIGGSAGILLRLEAPVTAGQVAVGDSVAIDGCCLTVVAIEERTMSFEAVPETLERTSLGAFAPGRAVNLESALRAGEPLGGHVMQGHVDAVGVVRSVQLEGEGKRIWLDAPEGVLRYVVEKGSIAVDGVSLTVAALDDAGFAVALIPHTLSETTLGTFEPGRVVNLEVDVLAKYVERMLASYVERLPTR